MRVMWSCKICRYIYCLRLLTNVKFNVELYSQSMVNIVGKKKYRQQIMCFILCMFNLQFYQLIPLSARIYSMYHVFGEPAENFKY